MSPTSSNVGSSSSQQNFNSKRDQQQKRDSCAIEQLAPIPPYHELSALIGEILLSISRLTTYFKICPQINREMLNLAVVLLDQSQTANVGVVMPYKQVKAIKEMATYIYGHPDDEKLLKHFASMFTNFCHLILGHFARIITRYLSECNHQENILSSALQQLTHIILFGEDLCVQVIQIGAIEHLVRICRRALLSTTRFALWSLAVLCALPMACIQMISLNGLDLIIRILCDYPASVAVEAAAILTQLTAANSHSFCATLPLLCLSQIVNRLLDLCDECVSCDSLLICTGALANLSLRQPLVAQHLYTNNAILRFSNHFNTPKYRSVYVHDKMRRAKRKF